MANRWRQFCSLFFLLALLVACAGPALEQDAERPAPGYAAPPATTGLLADSALWVSEQHGLSNSGFHLLDDSLDI